MIVLSAGSSVSVRDVTATVFDRLGDPGVLVHGIATRPGKPTIIGLARQTPTLGLPGNPVSAFVQFQMIGVPILYALQEIDLPPDLSLRAGPDDQCRQRRRTRGLSARQAHPFVTMNCWPKPIFLPQQFDFLAGSC